MQLLCKKSKEKKTGFLSPGIAKDKTIYNKYMFIPNDDNNNSPLNKLKSLMEKFGNYLL